MNWSALVLSAAVALTSLLPSAALSQTTSKVVYQHKAWTVYLVGYDDGSVSCVAQVDHSGGTFALWSDVSEEVRLQFYAEAWDFDGTPVDLNVQIDRRTPWELTNAETVAQSVWFTLDGSKASLRFLKEVISGNRLVLRNARGEHVETYTLSGSSASIGALIDCVDVLQGGSGNPFN